MLRRGETGEAMRERRRVSSWSASETGLHHPARIEECGTAVRIRREGQSLLIARSGIGQESLRDAVREAARRAGGSPFFKAVRRGSEPARARGSAGSEGDDEPASASLAAALARAVPDPRGLSLSLQIARVEMERAVITPRGFHLCGGNARLEVHGVIGRAEGTRAFSFQSSAPFVESSASFADALAQAIRPAARLSPAEGEVDVVFSPSAAAIFWHETVGHPLEAAAGEGSSVLSRVPGATIGPAGLEVIDDPTRHDLPGSFAHDDEGVVARPVPLIRDGRVSGLLSDRRTAGAQSNGHGRTPDYRRPPRARMSNLVVPPGTAPLHALIEKCGDGIFVTQISAGAADPESGRFVLFVEGADAIRRGKRSSSLTPFALSGEILSTLRHVDSERGDESLPALGLSICVKGGDALPVGGSAPAHLVRRLVARVSRR